MVGLRVLVRLLEYGYYVRAAVRTQAGFDKICSLPCLRFYGSQLSRVVVPDITDKWAYYEAILGVTYVVHVASPISCDNFTTVAQLRDHIIRPAVKGTVGILTAAQWSQSVKRVVITGSLVSIASEESIASGRMIDGKSKNLRRKSPNPTNDAEFVHHHSTYGRCRFLKPP